MIAWIDNYILNKLSDWQEFSDKTRLKYFQIAIKENGYLDA